MCDMVINGVGTRVLVDSDSGRAVLLSSVKGTGVMDQFFVIHFAETLEDGICRRNVRRLA